MKRIARAFLSHAEARLLCGAGVLHPYPMSPLDLMQKHLDADGADFREVLDDLQDGLLPYNAARYEMCGEIIAHI